MKYFRNGQFLSQFFLLILQLAKNLGRQFIIFFSFPLCCVNKHCTANVNAALVWTLRKKFPKPALAVSEKLHTVQLQ